MSRALLGKRCKFSLLGWLFPSERPTTWHLGNVNWSVFPGTVIIIATTIMAVNAFWTFLCRRQGADEFYMHDFNPHEAMDIHVHPCTLGSSKQMNRPAQPSFSSATTQPGRACEKIVFSFSFLFCHVGCLRPPSPVHCPVWRGSQVLRKPSEYPLPLGWSFWDCNHALPISLS